MTDHRRRVERTESELAGVLASLREAGDLGMDPAERDLAFAAVRRVESLAGRVADAIEVPPVAGAGRRGRSA